MHVGGACCTTCLPWERVHAAMRVDLTGGFYFPLAENAHTESTRHDGATAQRPTTVANAGLDDGALAGIGHATCALGWEGSEGWLGRHASLTMATRERGAGAAGLAGTARQRPASA